MFLSISSRVAGVGTGEGKIGSQCKLGENVQGWRGKVGCGAKAKVEGCAEGGAGDCGQGDSPQKETREDCHKTLMQCETTQITLVSINFSKN